MSSPLSPRELAVLEARRRGDPLRVIATDLGISESSVSEYLKRARDKGEDVSVEAAVEILSRAPRQTTSPAAARLRAVRKARAVELLREVIALLEEDA